MRLIFLIAFSLLFTKVFAIDTTKTWKQISKSFKTTSIKFKSTEQFKFKVLKTLQVVDLRYDKDRLGLYSDEYYYPTEIVIDKKESIEPVLKKMLTDETKGEQSILIVIQDLWMTDISPQLAGSNMDNQKRPVVNTSKLTCKLDIFLKQNENFIALTRIDTTVWDRKRMSGSADNLLEQLIVLLKENVEKEIIGNKYSGRKKLDINFIQNYYKKKISFAAITDKELNKGVYKTYDDFKTNKPVAVNLKIVEDKNEPPVLYLEDEKGNEQLSRNLWGVNDGNNIYIMQNGRLFKLYKNGNAFYWLGLKDIKLKAIGVPAGVPLGGGWALVGLEAVGTIVKFRLTPYLLNVEKGEAY